MFDRFDRVINYLRISVTDKCNFRCVYCMPVGGVPLLRHEDLLTFEEIADVARHAVALGVTKIRLTGGEPLVRRDIVSLVAMLAKINGLKDLAMTTNGALLAPVAQALAGAGLQRVNISLDAVDPARFAELTCGGSVQDVFEGIAAARAAGLTPIKLNCVIHKSSDEPDARAVKAFAQAEGLEVRFIPRMNLSSGTFSVVIGGTGGDCPHCNRLRLTCDGLIRPCLFSNLGFRVRDLGAREALQRAVRAKPACGETSDALFHTIGG